MTTYPAESFYRATIRQSILSTTSVPFTLKVSQIPVLTSWLLTISPNTANEEIIYYSAVDAVALTITVSKRGIKPSAQTLTTDTVDYNNTTYQKAHSQNDAIRWDVNHLHIAQIDGYFNLSENETTTWNNTHSGNETFTKSIKVPVYADATARDAGIPSPSNGMLIYNTALWILQQYIGGAWAAFASGTTSNADTTTAGKVEMSTTSEFRQGISTWGTWASAVVTPAQILALVSFGDGSDGDVTISSPTTLTRDMFYNDLVLNDTLTTWGYAIYVRWTISGTGKIVYNWNAWGNASWGTWGTAWAALATWTCGTNLWGSAWASWTTWGLVAWTAWTAVSPSYATTATASASGWAWGWNPSGWGAWGATASATQWVHYNTRFNLAQLLAELYFPARATRVTTPYWGLPSAGSGWAWTWNGAWTIGWGGGWSGGNWGIIYISARGISWTWTIEAKWGNWGNGAQSPNAGCWGWGGGGGGSGWFVVLVTNGTAPTITLTWGTWGTWGAANTFGNAGSAGGTWTTGQSLVVTV